MLLFDSHLLALRFTLCPDLLCPVLQGCTFLSVSSQVTSGYFWPMVGIGERLVGSRGEARYFAFWFFASDSLRWWLPSFCGSHSWGVTSHSVASVPTPVLALLCPVSCSPYLRCACPPDGGEAAGSQFNSRAGWGSTESCEA